MFDIIIAKLLHTNQPQDILLFIGLELLFWSLLSFILVQLLPRKYKPYKKEMFFFFVVINLGLLFIGIVLTLVMILFGLAWATHRISRPSYESINFEEQVAQFPVVYSEFQEGLLSVEGEHKTAISTDEKIKSLKILYDSNAQSNIEKIKHFLSDDSDETRLYAFALISSFEKKLNNQLKEIEVKIKHTKDPKRADTYRFKLANTYWQFIFHGVANIQLTGFYTQKIEAQLKKIEHYPKSFILLGKIYIFNREFDKAEKAFYRATELGIPQNAISTFLAEIKYEQGKYNEIAQHIIPEEFNLDLRLKPLTKMWSAS